jgi:hypothetical protein
MLRRAFSLLFLALVGSHCTRAQDSTWILWDPPRQMSFDSVLATVPQIAAVGDTMHLSWTQPYVGPKVYYRRSTDAGTTLVPLNTIPLSAEASTPVWLGSPRHGS